MNNSTIYYHNPNHIDNKSIDKVIIWLHGIGATGESFIELAKQLNLPFAVKFIFPNAPKRAVSVNNGDIRTSWFDILEKSQNHRKINIDELIESANRIVAIIDNEINNGMLAKHIIIAGFSQGGAVAYHSALSYKNLGGLIAVSTYFASDEYFKQQGILANTDLPILIMHGDNDTSVYPEFADIAKDKLAQLHLSAQVHYYPTTHAICHSEILDIKNWLKERFLL